MKIKLSVVLVIISTFILSCGTNSGQKVRESDDDDDLETQEVLEILANVKNSNKKSNTEAMKRLGKQPWTVTTILNWYEMGAPYYKPKGKSLKVTTLDQLRVVSKSQAKRVKSLTLSLKGTVRESDLNQLVALEKFSNLEYLQINNAKYAPIDLSGLEKLKTLNFNYIYDLEVLPINVGKLKNLEHLLITGANETNSLPEGVFDLIKLKTLVLTGIRLKEVSPDIARLTNLSYLEVSAYGAKLPDAIAQLTNLRYLNVNVSSSKTPFASIYKLKNLAILAIDISSPQDYSGIENLKKLKVLKLNSSRIDPQLKELKALEGLIISGFNGEQYPLELGDLSNLKALKIGSNNNLKIAPDFIPKLQNLRYLEIRGCNELKEFGESYSNMKEISLIELFYNDLITEVPASLSHLTNRIRIKQ